MTVLFFILILALAFISTPVFSLISAVTFFLFYSADIDSSAAIVEFMRLQSMPALISIPLFTFSGYVLAASKTPERMFNFAKSVFGFMTGGIAIASLIAAAVFTAFTGASGVTIIALGGLIYPILRNQGYSEKFSLGLMTTTGSLGLLFPPSLPIILYAIVGKLDLNQLFKAALFPGILLLSVLSVYAFFSARKAGIKNEKLEFKKIRESFRAVLWELPLPFLIIGGIYKGVFTASEAASIMAFYVLVVEVFVYKDLNLFRDIPKIVVKSMLLVGSIFIVLGTALGFTNYIIDAQIPERLFAWLHAYVPNKLLFLFILNIFILLINMIEIFSAIIIVVPIIVPVAMNYGIDPIHLGIIFLLNLELGYMTPPLGLNLFLSSVRFEKPLNRIYGSVWVFWLIVFAALILITYFPQLMLI
ncbi:MAG: C4-dicarboxylate ABC transporter [Elusimicrobia bacterium CG08_land_8_20_14_0_20_51_18]|nr:MAG: C4-dicarboxylate ABC transporter [Elusimicrobia bacterium CG08_land_8_20_14_0_20_51_18]